MSLLRQQAVHGILSGSREEANRAAGLCPCWGYNLAGNPGAVCPECGARVPR